MMLYSRTLHYKHRDCTILLQDGNGPCPLVAVVNALILKGNLTLPRQTSSAIPIATVEDVFRNYLATHRLPAAGHNAHDENAVSTAISLIPQLRNGLDVNPYFTSITAFEATDELTVFDSCRVKLVHGFLVGNNEAELASEVSGRSYNAMLLLSTQGKAPNFGSWHRDFPTQLTFLGLFSLSNELSEGEVCVFFRNNHFSVLTKEGSTLYTLVSDVGVATSSPSTPWESLNDITGAETVLTDCYFGKVAPPAPSQTQSIAVAEDDEGPKPPPRRNSALIKRVEGGGESEVIMLNKEERKAAKPLTSEFSVSENAVSTQKSTQDSCCGMM